ncbi:MAG: hypothetical protein JXR65_10740 [Bacteroidales bacterium]|nr:hypothetical protein [Bacteroidales bacterium]
MKKKYLLIVILCYFLPLANASDVKIIFNKPIEAQNITLVKFTDPASEGFTEEAVRDNLHCLYVPNGKYAYFQVNDQIIPSSEKNLILELTFFDDGNGYFYFQYNAISGNYQKITINKSNTNTWISLKVAIRDASFKNAQNNKADFRISAGCYVRQITLSKGELIPGEEAVPITKGSTYSEFRGKSVAGYQSWFRASHENTGWVHWPKGGQTRPSAGQASFEIYPHMDDYNETERFTTGFANFGNGEAATLFNSPDVIEVHFDWMKTHGIDGIALQRFIGDTPYPILYSDKSIPVKVKKAAENNKKIFYICYDMSSGKDESAWVESIKFDWVYNIEQTMALTSSPAYATVDNRPVVEIWGPGFTTRVGNADKTIELIDFLKSRGCYVIGGVPTGWREEERDSKPGFLNAYKKYDMVSPWTPGRYRDINEINTHASNYWKPDQAFCNANQIDYFPVLFPGFAWSTWHTGLPNQIPRIKGEFLWQQALQIKQAGIKQMYFAMFDEYDEGTALMKGATDWSDIPTDQYFLTYSADGMWLSADFYLRLSGAATSMIKSNSVPTPSVPIPYSEGPVYYRNSFEQRNHSYQEKENGAFVTGTFNLDPCFNNPKIISRTNINNASCTIENNPSEAKSGLHHINFSGEVISNTEAQYCYKIADVKIPVAENLQISFWKKSITQLGRYANVDLVFKSGKRLSQLSSYQTNMGTSINPASGMGNTKGEWENVRCLIGKGELLGDEISEIAIKYDKPANNESIKVLFDDFIIATNLPEYDPNTGIRDYITGTKIRASKKTIYFDGFELNSKIQIMNLCGQIIHSGPLMANQISFSAPDGIYLITVTNRKEAYCQKIKL